VNYLEAMGHVLRTTRTEQNKTLRQLSAKTYVSLNFISEIERGRKSASGHMIEAVCAGLNLPVWQLLKQTSEQLELHETNKTKENA
jgi:transcriptional regulator with XRE-family HTH domain